MKRLAFLALFAVVALAAPAQAKLRFADRPATTLVPTSVVTDATNKGGTVELLHSAQSWITDSNAVWSSATIRRYPKAIVRWPAAWTSKVISFDAQCTTLTNSDGKFSVVVDGALAATVTGTGDTFVHHYDVANLAVSGSGSTVEVWEPFAGRVGSLNNGSDGPIEACYVTAVWLPPGQAASFAQPRSTTAIVTVGDSILADNAGQSPELWGSELGIIRKDAEAKGWLVVSLDYGSCTLRGDGPTPANLATLIQSAAASTGATTVYVYFQIGRNDYAYNGTGLSSTPTQVGNDLQTTVTALPAGWNKVVMTPLPNTTESANAGGFTVGNYRTSEAAVTGTNVTIISGTSCGIVPATDTADGVHLNSLGSPKAAACAEPALSLP